MMERRAAVHRMIVVADVERFGRHRSRQSQVSVRDGLYAALEEAFDVAGVPWLDCYHEDRGDGVLVLAPGEPKGPFAESLPAALVEALHAQNGTRGADEAIRLRVALNAGEIVHDGHGVTGTAITVAFRMLDSTALRTALAESPGVLALAVSPWFYDEVVVHLPAAAPLTYRRVPVVHKETSTHAWVSLPDHPYAPRESFDEDVPESEFERHYLEVVRDNSASFELFQVSLGRAAVGYAFDEYYVTPPIARRQTDEPRQDQGLTGAGTDPGNAVAGARRVLLLGGAGAGKTTFLTWLTHVAATRRDTDGPWRGVVPFFLSLRHFASSALPEQPEELLRYTAPMLAGEKPDKWVSGLFASGRAMLLVDGLDELVADRREYAKRWLAQFMRTYRTARYVVSTRPSAVDDQWCVDAPDRVGLLRFELLPLSSRGLGRVIEKWFAAAASQETDPDQQAWLKQCQTRLWEGLATRPNLRTLVSSPLLAGLLCALYRQNKMFLPRTRRELLDQALDLLLTRWDDTKPSSTDAAHGVAVEEELRMTLAEQLILLERFAAPMVRERELVVSRELATSRLERAMVGLRSHGLEPDRLLQHMLVRTGLLREYPADGKIEFVHRTFRDYLAAADMVGAGEFTSLIDHAHEDSWYEVVFMAAAQARPREVAGLLDGLLHRAAQQRGADVADRLTLIAAACLGYADVVFPDSKRIEVQAAARRLIPPASFHDAEMLARAGEFVVDLLPGPDELSGPDDGAAAARVIRTLAMIGGEEAWERISPFTAMHEATVVDELLRAWRQFDFAERYARTLLSKVDFGERVLEVRRWELLSRLRHLPRLHKLKIIGDVALADPRPGLYPLADIPNLRSLDIVANQTLRDLSALAGCRGLRALWVSGHSMLRDLSAPRGTRIEELGLHTIGMAATQTEPDLATLAGMPLRYLSVRHSALDTGLRALPADLPLTELVVVNRAEHRCLLGVERFPRLAKLTASGVPSAAEVAALGELPGLRHLVLNAPGPPADLARLRPLAGRLDRLELHGVDKADLPAARKALGAELAAKLRA